MLNIIKSQIRVTTREGRRYLCHTLTTKTLKDGNDWLIMLDTMDNEVNVIRFDAVWNIELVNEG